MIIGMDSSPHEPSAIGGSGRAGKGAGADGGSASRNGSFDVVIEDGKTTPVV
jgi:hypothetical protein